MPSGRSIWLNVDHEAHPSKRQHFMILRAVETLTTMILSKKILQNLNVA